MPPARAWLLPTCFVLAPLTAHAGGTELTLPRFEGVVRKHLNEAVACYRDALPDQPDLAGAITLGFRFRTSERPDVQLEGDALGAPEVARCLLERARRWRFPAARSGQEFSFVFEFVPD